MTDNELRSQRETILVTLLLVLGSMFILYPFLDAIVLAIVVSYLLRFGHERLDSRLDNELLSSTIVISAVVVGLVAFLYFFINNFFDILSQFNQFTGSLRSGILSAVDFLNLSEQFQANVESVINRVSDRATNELVSTFASIPTLLIDVGIFLVTTLFLYKDRNKLENQLRSILNNIPEPERGIVKSLLKSIDEIFKGVFMTQFIVAFILALVAGMGFYLISMVTSPVPFIPLWSILIGVAALLPLVAAFMIYGPIGIYYFMIGDPLKGALILIFGSVVINVMTEIFLRPYIGSKQMDEHPLVIFLGFLTGPLVLGFKGIIIGPLLLILTKEFALNYTSGPSSGSSQTHIEGTAEN
ncbi:AI-2E family transporter [Candidatus Nanosalina sp. VS9-1]|uniref:AI-2E family transporter n=1 Tax=Candidatus Nanosalina sp. VS9-1 TaxID=3388566 RepID=UPI0039E18125